MDRYKKFIAIAVVVILAFGALFFNVQKTQAIPVTVLSDITAQLKWVWEKVEKAYDKIQGWVGADLANRTMEMFMNDLAYQVATELATGGTGGKPLFRTESISKSLQHAQEAAVGEFIGQLSDTYFADLGLNLCDPTVNVKLTLTLSLIDQQAPPTKTPRCNWRDVQKQWQNFGEENLAGLLQFQLSPQGGAQGVEDYFKAFTLEQSDLGVFAKLQAEINNRKIASVEVLKLQSSECQGFIDKTTTVTEEVKTHCRTILNMNEEQWVSAVRDSAARIAARKDAATNRKLSDIIKDAASNFANTLTSKLMQRWIKGGMWSFFGRSQGEPDYRETLLAQLRGGGNIRQPRNADVFMDFKNIKISPIEAYSFINDFSVCPDETQFRKPDNCVMSTDLLQAINNKLTVKEAVERGVLNGSWQFINPSDVLKASQDCYKGAFCYNNLVKLRKANIIPVGWEMASQRSDLITPVTLQQAMDCFEDDAYKCPFAVSNDYAVDNEPHNPFYHLVDPNWVLKVSPAYCSAYVYGSVLESPDSSNRQQYCADAQVCLREDDNGNCLDNQFGYCTKSENIWRLGGDACQEGETYSGCLIFEHPDIGRQSYLEQTLSYCSSDQVGCKRYSQEMNSENNWVLQALENDNDDLFLNRQSQECPSSEAGCREYIVMAADRGINLLANGSFVDIDTNGSPDGWDNVEGNQDVEYFEEKVRLQDEISHEIYLLPNTSYILSADAAQESASGVALAVVDLEFCDNTGNCASGNTAGTVANLGTCVLNNAGVPSASLQFTPAGEDMERSSCSFVTNQYVAGGKIVLNNPSIWYDNIKVEIVSDLARVASTYSSYGEGGKITMNDSRFMCTADELGCQGYTPAGGGPMIPAVVNPSDICPAECVGYASFAETPNTFSVIEGDTQTQYYNFIPKSAKGCPASAIGCEEFTNLDEVAQGGEGKEYFTYVRQCVAENLGTTYYTWEGSDTAGYQIRTWQILDSNPDAAVVGAPCTNIEPDGVTCLDNTPGYAPALCGAETPETNDDPNVNPNCREFFDSISGNSFYRFQDRVIFASSDCHEYRRTASGAVYKMIPDLSIACLAADNGCHLYTGNTANNVREIFSNNFEQGTYEPWLTGNGNLDISSEALENNGHSLKYNKTASLNGQVYRSLSNIQAANKQYQFSTWVKSDVTISQFNVSISNTVNPVHVFDSESVSNLPANSWRYLTFTLDADTTSWDINDLRLTIEAITATVESNIYFDNIIFKEISDNISVVRNSWQTPIACDSPYAGYHLGCRAYNDTNNVNFNLRSFSNLCRVEAIGCTAVIDTQNSSYPYDETFNSGNYAEITVATDSLAYLVPDSTKYCAQEYKGCQALGLPDRENPYLLNTVYKINNPDQYSSSLCTTDGLGCEEYASDKGVYYFRDPGSATCTYQNNVQLPTGVYSGWFKTTTLDTTDIMGCSDYDGVFDTADLELNNCVWATAQGLTGFFRQNSLLTTEPMGCWPNNNGFLDAGDLITDNFAATCPEEENLCTALRDPSDPESCDPSIDPTVLDGVCRDSDGDIIDYDSRLSCENASGRWTPACETYYYYKNSNIDEKSCAGQVDKNNGCILLYDANDWQSNHELVSALYDSGKTYDQSLSENRAVSPVVCDPEIDGSCTLDANMLVKVKKDRQCSEWLACRSSTAVWDKDNNRYKTVCDDVAACVEYDRNNNITKCKKWAPASPELTALNMSTYQNRDTGTNGHLQWSDEEYLGYSVPNMLPVKDLTVNDFSNGSIRVGYPYYDTVTNSGNYFAACRSNAINLDGRACNVNTDQGNFVGECDTGYCWLNPRINEASTSTLALSTRGYAMSDAPFPHSIFPSDENQGPLRAYTAANFCQVDNRDIDDRISTPNGCETNYRKITYGVTTVRYYPLALGFPNAVCTAGNTSHYDCNTNADCDNLDNNNNSRGDGLCEKYTKIETVNNWPGICLDYDYGNKLIKDESSDFYCNQWYPAEQISGTNSLYENYQEAGYYNQSGQDALFCAVTEPYVVPEDRFYCVKSIHFWEQDFCSVLAKVPAGTKIHLRYMGTEFNNTLALRTLTTGYLNTSPEANLVNIYGPNDTVTDDYSGLTFNGVRNYGWNAGVQSAYTGLGVNWLHREGALPLFDDPAGYQQNWRDPLSISEGARSDGYSLFIAPDFDSTGTLGLNMSSRIPVLPLEYFDYIFDADAVTTGQVQLYFYDVQINRFGDRSEAAAIWPYASRPGQEYYPIGMYAEYGIQKTNNEYDRPLYQCQPGYHESWFNQYLDGDFNNANVGGWNQLGWDGDGHKEQHRWCSPMSHGIYVSPSFVDTGNTVRQCNQENCSRVNATGDDTVTCLNNDTVYTNINVAEPCNGNLNCEFKNCIIGVGSPSHPNPPAAPIYWCSDFGVAQTTETPIRVDYECPNGTLRQVVYDNYTSISGCLDIIYDVGTELIPNSIAYNGQTCQIIGAQNQTYGTLVLTAGVEPLLGPLINQCTDPYGIDTGVDCTDITVSVGTGFWDLSSYRRITSRINLIRTDTPYQPGRNGSDCLGLDCYQQCQIVTQLDANADLSWVRTDMWWRYSRAEDTLIDHDNIPAGSANYWRSWYYKSLNNRANYVQSSTVNYSSVLGESLSNVFTHFGAALEYFDTSDPVVTRIPLDQNFVVPSAATFFSYTDWNSAQSDMARIFARVYNLRLVNGNYEEDSVRDIAGNINPNTAAGPDYAPRALKVCGDTACAVRNAAGSVVGYQRGITINEQQNTNLVAAESLFVAVKSYFYAHPDHMPVVNIEVDWDDNSFSSAPGRYKNALFSCDSASNMPNICSNDQVTSCVAPPGEQGFGGLDRACRVGYKIFYHDYQYTNEPLHACATQTNPPDANDYEPGAACFKPIMYITDRWGQRTSVPYDAWIIVNP